MKPVIVDAKAPVTLVAGGPVRRSDLRLALSRAPVLIAADGGADRALALGARPEAVVGDLDSLSAAARAQLGALVHEVAEQETTDFDKALAAIRAPLVIALGAIGGRADHALAALSGLMRHSVAGGGPVILLGPEDVIFAAPARLSLALRAGDRLSIYPLASVSGRSLGLDWPIDGLALDPMGRIGTSNRVSTDAVVLEFDGPGALLILPAARLDAVIRALCPARDGAPPPPAPAR